MDEDVFAGTSFGRAALAKLAPVAVGFRLFEAERFDPPHPYAGSCRVVGAVFRAALTGPRKGRLVIEVKGTRRATLVSSDECARFKNGR